MDNDQIEKLSIILPVFNEGENLKIMVQILKATMEVSNEVLIVYDFSEDDSISVAKWLQDRYPTIRLVHNQIGRGVPNAIKAGIQAAEGDVILISVVDEVLPIARIEDMLNLIRSGCDFVSVTRYALGGRRLGGSPIGHVLSWTANSLFRVFAGSLLTDATTGMKMMRKEIFDKITIEAQAAGWACAFEMAIKAQLYGFKLGELPVVSVDRLFGGESTFQLGPWVKEYFRWFRWGQKEMRRAVQRPDKVYTLRKYKKLTRGKHYEIIDNS